MATAVRARGAGRCLAPRAAVVGALLAAAPQAALAHGGAAASAFLIDPDAPGVVVDQSFRFTWLDASDRGDATPDTTHDFFFTQRLPPPWPVLGSPEGLEGTPIARGIPEAATSNALTWSTATVAAGAYWIWSIANDPDLEEPGASVVFSPYPVVVAHPGDPVHPFLTLETPDSPAAFAEDDRYTVEYVAFDPDGTGVVTLERALDGTTAWTTVQAGLPAVEEGRVEVDTSSWAPGDYVIRGRIEDARGLDFRTFARFTLQVARLSADAGASAPDDAGAPAPGDAGRLDAGVARADGGQAADGSTSGSGCRCATPSSTRGGVGLVLLAAALIGRTAGRRGRFAAARLLALRRPRS